MTPPASRSPIDPARPVEDVLPERHGGPDPIDHDAIDQMIADAGITDDVDLIHEIVATALRMGTDDTDRLDLKIVAHAVLEMRAAFAIFAPYRHVPKVTIFGSARTRADDPQYVQTHDMAAALAAQGWMVVTGAGPGIMQAAMEGAGVDRSIGVSIRLPFETAANAVIAGDPKLVSMKYFFTRKLMLVKESLAFVSVPGGFGTLDETFELLTLQQTGKAEPTPIVLLDVPDGGYWRGLTEFVDRQLVPRGLVTANDLDRALVTESVDDAVAEITGFYRNYHSLRWVGDRLVLRLRAAPTDEEVADLDRRFRRHLAEGHIRRSEPLPPEQSSNDEIHLSRLSMVWDPYEVGEMHQLIRAINQLGSAPGGA